MPLYVYKCEEHGKHEVYSHRYEPKETSTCPTCGKTTCRDWTGCGRPDPFTPYWTDSLSTSPRYIATKKQEHDIEKRHGINRVY